MDPTLSLSLAASVARNDADADVDGGAVVARIVDPGAVDVDLLGGTLVLNTTSDEFLRRFPLAKAERQGWRLRIAVTLEEVPPPAPEPAPEPDATPPADPGSA